MNNTNLYSAKMTKNEEVTRIFLDKEKLRKFVISRPALKEWLKENL